jgi:hypothetical protein
MLASTAQPTATPTPTAEITVRTKVAPDNMFGLNLSDEFSAVYVVTLRLLPAKITKSIGRK